MATENLPRLPGELVIDSPDARGIRIPLEQTRYRLGRSTANELSFPGDQRLSREHLRFERVAKGWTVRDLGSRNGAWINGAQLAGTVGLTHGDCITAGHLSIRYDTRGEFRDAKSYEIQFVGDALESATQNDTVSVDLPAALKSSTEGIGRGTVEGTQLGALLRAGRELAGHCPLADLFQLILDLTLDAVKASRGVVMTLEAGGDLKARAMKGERLRISTAVRDRVLEQRKSLLVRDTGADSDFAMQQSILAQEIRSILAVPLQTDERVIGMIYLDSPHLIHDFTVDDLGLVTVMANIAAIRIEHARLMEIEQARKLLTQELERAAEIQRRLLPARAPEITGFDLAGYNAPCLAVGGDYYEFLHYPNGRVALLIGDVSGKGMGAALLMSSLQARVQVLFDSPGELAERVSRLNRITTANCPGNCFITFFVAVLDPATGAVSYCNAGHNAPLLLRANGGVESLTSTGMVLGIVPNARYEEEICRMDHGDMLVLFSDGVTEACRVDCDEQFGEEQLAVTLKAQGERRAADILESVIAEIGSFTGGVAAADDVTLVLARRL
jgi:sigma-B regulation protein RsbU (phosphoserine phosphatase)